MAILTQSNTPRYEGRRVTREEYLDLPDDGFQYDMIEGVLHMSPSAFSNHGECQAKFSHRFLEYFGRVNSGKVILEVDVYFPDGKDVLRPDISIVLKENYKIIIGHIHGVPDIVVEVLSAATKERDLGVKAVRYLSNGVKEYWIADPDEKSISLWINVDDKKWNKIVGIQIESSILPGLIIDRENVFPKL